jgi:hypothetical protein
VFAIHPLRAARVAQVSRSLILCLVRSMWRILYCLMFAGLLAFPSCSKPHGKFKPGDKVTYAHSKTRPVGIVYSRFNTDEPYYYVRFPGTTNDMNVLDWPYNDQDKTLRWHMEGPFGDDDLELAQR